MPYTSRLLGVSTSVPVPAVSTVAAVPAAVDGAAVPARVDGAALPGDAAEPTPAGARRQRFAAYGLVTDPAGRVLLTLNADGYPGARHWHLPGGGTDFGESAVDGLLRELVEETDQRGRVTGLMGVSHRYQGAEIGPEGVPLSWHGVRAVYRVEVDRPTPARVVETSGSTAAAAWFTVADALARPLTDIAHEMIADHLSR
jgi:ADP-ribose pyrophosphatase YjhB (NUDIX family)